MPYDVATFRADPRLFGMEENEVYAGAVNHISYPEDVNFVGTEFHRVIIMNEQGCVVHGHYMMPDAWLCARTQDDSGAGIYIIPWDAVKSLVSEEEATVIYNREASDLDLLGNAR